MQSIKLYKTQSELDSDLSNGKFPKIAFIKDGKKSAISKAPQGCFILGMDGNFYKSNEWNKKYEDAVGIAVIEGEHKFVIAKDYANKGWRLPSWDGYGIDVIGVCNTNDETVADTDMDGEGNTIKILRTYGTNEAVNLCYNYIFPNGKRGYLGSLGEWNIVLKYVNEINRLHDVILKTEKVKIDESENKSLENDSIPYWTSTQYGNYHAWIVSIHSDGSTNKGAGLRIGRYQGCRPLYRIK